MDQKQAIADRLKQANNILVTVSNNPSVDQLASCIGLTLALNKMGKHATAVFSGTVPNTIEFLQPEKTIEKNTDSLRDFIIALDKAKADKLRYKVEDKVVKIFITPYKTSITEKDLDFSQGDFNVDLVLALGVHQQTDLDQAITSHGRILHDAVVATINTQPGGEIGTINWVEPVASSLSELVVQLLDHVDKSMMDGQMATALLTGIVAETDRFSNEKTTPATMSISAELMGAGANQQLVATKLEEPAPPPPPPPPPPVHDEPSTDSHQADHHDHEETHVDEDGTLEIAHDSHEEASQPPPSRPSPPPPAPEPAHEREPSEPPVPQIHIDDQGSLRSIEHTDARPKQPLFGGPSIDPTQHMASSHTLLQPPTRGEDGQPDANGPLPEDAGSGDPLSLPQPNEPSFGDSIFGAQPPASASIAAPAMPYMPPSMTPGATAPAPSTPQPTPPPPMFASAPPAPGVQMAQSQPTASALMPPLPPPASVTQAASLPTPTSEPPAPPSETLSQIEADVNSPHVQPGASSATDTAGPPVPEPHTVAPTIMPPAPEPAPESPASAPATTQTTEATAEPSNPDLASARDAVLQAIAAQPQSATGAEPPIQALNAQPLGAPLHEDTQASPPQATAINYDATANPTFTLPDATADAANNGHGATPPAMPPPMMPPANYGQ